MIGAATLDSNRRDALEAAWAEFAGELAAAHPEPPHPANLERLHAAFFAGAIAAAEALGVLRNGPARAELLREVRDYVSGVRMAAGDA